MILPHRHTTFKEGCEKQLLEEYQRLRVRGQIVSDDMSAFCESHGYEYLITDILSDALEDAKLERVSKSHSEGRAWDVRTRNWPEWFRVKFKRTFEARYPHYAALAKSDGLPTLIVYHDNGHGAHAHNQIRPYKEQI